MGKSLAEQIAELTHSAPKDVDPELAELGHESDSSSSEDQETLRAHYAPVERSRLRSHATEYLMEDPRYRGQRVRRADLYSDSDAESVDNGSMADDLELGSDAEFSDSEVSQDSHSASEMEDPDSASMSDVSDSKEDEPAPQKPQPLAVRRPAAPQANDLERAHHTRNQLQFYDGLLDMRIRSQRCLNLANAMPLSDLFPFFMRSEVASEQTQQLRESLSALISSLTGLQHELVFQNKEQYTDAAPDTDTAADRSEWVQSKVASLAPKPLEGCTTKEMWQQISALDEHLLSSFRDATVQKWNNKVQVASVGAALAGKKFKALNQSIPQQIEQLMQSDSQRLLKRTQMLRGSRKSIGASLLKKRKREEEAAAEEADVPVALEEESLANEDVFDDNDFYASVLRELIDNKTADVDDPLVLGMQWAELKKLQGQTKKRRENVDRKASKGRRLRYDAHEKLQSFMVPIEKATWHDEMTTALFQSLRQLYLGQERVGK